MFFYVNLKKEQSTMSFRLQSIDISMNMKLRRISGMNYEELYEKNIYRDIHAWDIQIKWVIVVADGLWLIHLQT